MIEYEYRVMLETLDGSFVPLLSQGPDLDGAEKRLRDILDNPGSYYVKGWLERRKPSSWETFSHASVTERN